MRQRGPVTSNRLCGLVIALATGLSLCAPLSAADTASEASQLAALERLLDALDRQAHKAEQRAAEPSGRYYFDYARLHSDLARIRSGIHEYLNPPRAQPRDDGSLDGQYQQQRQETPP
jgi:RAQPRD family integrative conjugative element protein